MALMINTPPAVASAAVRASADCLVWWYPPLLHRTSLSRRFWTPKINVSQTVENSPPGPTPYINFGQQTGNMLTWQQVNATIGTSLILGIKDNTGLKQNSGAFTIIDGVGDGCLNGASDPGSSGSAPPPPPASSDSAGSGSSLPSTGTPTSPGSPPKSSAPTSSKPAGGSTSPAPPNKGTKVRGAASTVGIAMFAMLVAALLA
ncbi:hypothetical protein MKEN_00495500 [Mycena kentingensis (nom. inval.)]|nr:hypothetical protein MKEN_00495500 [Mycena kentingensis (nom. inval.)]